MFNLNTYQEIVYKKLKELELELDNEIKIYDKVTANAKFPFIILSDYQIQEGQTKDYNCFLLEQKLEIWSDYDGKKEVNDILTKTFNKLGELQGASLDDESGIDSISLMPSTVNEVEGFFNANLNVQIEIY